MYKPIGIEKLGEKLLFETLSSAYYATAKTPFFKIGDTIYEGRSCFTFLTQNSGIHQIITLFNLHHIDPEKLQDMFFYYIDIA